MVDEELDKLGTYFVHQNTARQYGLTFEQFVEKVRDGSWPQYLADRMTLDPLVRELCNSR